MVRRHHTPSLWVSLRRSVRHPHTDTHARMRRLPLRFSSRLTRQPPSRSTLTLADPGSLLDARLSNSCGSSHPFTPFLSGLNRRASYILSYHSLVVNVPRQLPATASYSPVASPAYARSAANFPPPRSHTAGFSLKHRPVIRSDFQDYYISLRLSNPFQRRFRPQIESTLSYFYVDLIRLTSAY